LARCCTSTVDLQQAQAATVLIAMLALVLAVDTLSDRLRGWMGRS